MQKIIWGNALINNRIHKIITSAAALTAIFFSLFYAVFLMRYPRKYTDIIAQEAERYGVDIALVQAVIWTESKYDADAVSGAGAKGLMQLLPSTAQWCAEMCGIDYDETDIFEPQINIRLGVYYLSFLLKSFDERDAVAAYNAGQGNVAKWLAEGKTEYPFKETRDYVKRVYNSKNIYNYLNRHFKTIYFQ